MTYVVHPCFMCMLCRSLFVPLSIVKPEYLEKTTDLSQVTENFIT